MRRWKILMFLLPALFRTLPVFSESVVLVNLTGKPVQSVRIDEAGGWGENLIGDSVIPDGGTVRLDLPDGASRSFRLTDIDDVLYIVYDAVPSSSGKIVVEPEHQTRLSVLAGVNRRISLTNRTGYTITELRISPVSAGDWGPDVLGGRILRHGETVRLDLETAAGTLGFDLQMMLLTDDGRLRYRKTDVILTDGASLVLSAL